MKIYNHDCETCRKSEYLQDEGVWVCVADNGDVTYLSGLPFKDLCEDWEGWNETV